MKVLLCDRNEPLCNAWRETFRGIESVEIVHGDIFDLEAAAIVSPRRKANVLSVENALRRPHGRSRYYPVYLGIRRIDADGQGFLC